MEMQKEAHYLMRMLRAYANTTNIFMRLSEELAPEQLVPLVNNILCNIVRSLLAYTIDPINSSTRCPKMGSTGGLQTSEMRL